MGDDLVELRSLARSWGREFRAIGDELARAPDDPRALLDSGGARALAAAGCGAAHGGTVIDLDDGRFDLLTAQERVVVMEELARGDLGCMLASPGPSMSGVLVQQLGSDQQRRAFFDRFVEQPTWSSFALTEPARGSDPAGMTTELDASVGASGAITGVKRYIGNATRASVAAVFARNAPGPLGIGAYLVELDQPSVSRRALPTVGLRAARVGELAFSRTPVLVGGALGAHLSALRRGLHAARGVFDRLRPGVAALALGVAWGAFDIAIDQAGPRPGPVALERLRQMEGDLRAGRLLIARAARAVDEAGDGALAAAAKRSACRLAERITLDVAQLLGPGARLDLPRLERAIADARGVEFMEGAGNIQRLTVAQTLIARGRL